MLDIALVPDQTVEANGNGSEAELGPAAGHSFLATLRITRQVEQSSLDVGIYTSEDNAAWSAKPIAAFPQKFYTGEHQIVVDLSAHPGVKYVRAGWTVARWGRGLPTPRFGFSVRLKELASVAA